MKQARAYLGCQLWLEPDDPPERIERLFEAAAEAGLGWVRLFLMWPWIEAEPGEWRFEPFDRAFDAAAKVDIRIKATLTANSGPWHVGTPAMLHSHTGFLSPAQREPMRRYILASVRRYVDHPALGQWILWNEPSGGEERTDETRAHWQRWLSAHYEGDLGRLNRRWLTGYRAFADVPFPEQIPHERHAGLYWNSYGPWLADWQARAAWLNDELRWVRDVVREVDPRTETCVNPTSVLGNQAAGGTDLDGMGAIVDVIGATYHPAWGFTFAERSRFPALMAAGVRLEASHPSIRRVEVTEVQSGNTLNSSHRPCEVSPDELARFYLAGIVAGAESVTGWSLNVRSHDFEAGDWGLLDDDDQQSVRSRMLRRVHDRLDAAFTRTGAWAPAPPRAWVAIDPRSQAIEWIEAFGEARVPGRMGSDGGHGAALLAVALMEAGMSTTMARADTVPDRAPAGGLIAISHLVAWDDSLADRLLSFVGSGGSLLLDATSGRKNLASSLHRPWPGGLAERTGWRAVGLQTRPEGWELSLNGLGAGRWLLARLVAELDPAAGWEAWSEPRYEEDGEPCVWERSFGEGRLIVTRGMLGPSLVHSPNCLPAVAYILARVVAPTGRRVRPVGSHPSTFVVPVNAEQGSLSAVFAPSIARRDSRPLRLAAPQGRYLDLWTGDAVDVGTDGELVIAADDGIALLWQP